MDSSRKIGLQPTADGLALSIDGHEFMLTTEEAVRLGDMLQRARVCPLCEQFMLLERNGMFPEHGCRITIAPAPSVQMPKRRPRKALAAGRGGVEAANYVLHIPRSFATPRAGTFTFCNRRAVDVNLVGLAREIEQNPEAQCRICLKAWRRSAGAAQ